MVSLKLENSQFLWIQIRNREHSHKTHKAEQAKNEQTCNSHLDTRIWLTAIANRLKINNKSRRRNLIHFSRFYFLSIWLNLNFLTTKMCIEPFLMKESYGHSHPRKQPHRVLPLHYQINQIRLLLMHIEDHKSQFNINLKNEREKLEESPLVLVRLSTTKTKTKSCKRFLDQIRVTKNIATWQRSVTNLIREAWKRKR